MKVKRVDGILLEKMLRNGLNYLRQYEAKVNDMNVFPVPDGDTGSNMRLTLENGLKMAESNNHAGNYLASVAQGMLMGARGNSGVILSQIFKGFAEDVKRDSIIDAREFSEGFTAGYKKAYEVVIKPVEGTLLTVAREAIEHLKGIPERGMYIDALFSMYLAEAKKTLSYTPELLPVLKEANVLDSGGYGYVLIIEGMLKYLHDEIVSGDIEVSEVKQIETKTFDENSSFDYGYCMEFILQLMTSRTNINGFNLNLFIDELNDYGESLVVVKDETKVKVHIHTLKPARIITYCQQFGEFVSFKLENMSLQHSSTISKKEPIIKGDLIKIGIVNGEEIKQIYSDLGCHIIIDGGKTMNTSSSEIMDALKKIDAKKIVIYTNNKNIILACEQAIHELNMSNVNIIKTNNILEGYYALAMDEVDNDNLEYRLKQMEEGAKAIKTICFFKASKDSRVNGFTINKGDKLALVDDKIIACSDNYLDIINNALASVKEVKEASTCILLTGKELDYDVDDIINSINDKYDNLDVNSLTGGQEIFDLIIGLV